MGRNIWLKIIVVVIIQALLLTQVDFALAAMFQSKDTFREAALRFQRISAKSVSLIDGIGCVQLSLNVLRLPRLDLAAIFNFLEGNEHLISEVSSAKQLRAFNNEIYKVLILALNDVHVENLSHGLYENIVNKKMIIARSRTEASTGPPAVNAKLNCFLINRIV